MGQAWCKEKSTKAQDSKSPLDRVFVRCAHRIYPSLKEEGSVLGGATQRVTSSEIGYAGSPSREVLTRGRSIDSVDRPFHPSEWVDVNLEVPSTPRTDSTFANLSLDSNLYPTTITQASSYPGNREVFVSKGITPIPPPRHRKKNRGRPLPPKPDELPETHLALSRSVQSLHGEPLYSSVKSPKSRINREGSVGDKEESYTDLGRTICSTETGKWPNGESKKKEIFEHKVNGTGRVIPSIVVSGGKLEDCKPHSQGVENYNKSPYEDYVKITKDPSEENPRGNSTYHQEAISGQKRQKSPTRSKNHSTVSLPSYDELEVVKHAVEKAKEAENLRKTSLAEKLQIENGKTPQRNASTGSLPVESIFTSFSQKTAERLENYVTRCRSFGSLLPHQILDRLRNEEEQTAESSEDEWSGLDDWDLGVVEHYEPDDGRATSVSNSRHREKKSPKFNIGGENLLSKRTPKDKGEDVVDSGGSIEERQKRVGENGKDSIDPPGNGTIEVPKSGTAFKSGLKLETGGKTSTPLKADMDTGKSQKTTLEDWFLGQERSVGFFDSKDEDSTPAQDFLSARDDKVPEEKEGFKSFLERSKDTSESFFEAREDPRNAEANNVDNGEVEPRGPSKTLKRTLSNESEPYDSYEEKELVMDIRSQSSVSKISRTISEESLPREMLEEVDIDEEEDFFEVKLAKDVQNKMTKDFVSPKEKSLKTPPPSPEPKIKAEILDNDHSTLLKVLKEAGGEESNLSSMTPSLTELEAALSDMLEKEEEKQVEVDRDPEELDPKADSSKFLEKLIEPKILPMGVEKPGEGTTEDADQSKLPGPDPDRREFKTVSLELIINDSSCSQRSQMMIEDHEESDLVEVDLRNGDVHNASVHPEMKDHQEHRESNPASIGDSPPLDLDCPRTPDCVVLSSYRKLDFGHADIPPEKPSRLHRVTFDEFSDYNQPVPTPPRRRHRSGSRVSKEDASKSITSNPGEPDPHRNDRLI
ncbi:uncharacterized protein LOC105703487 [Orussus abietinus]|uniref:uncharacterized protein LOC105703487 n=1 Tax=Orussus abietinus TaxID=222816 RepID=UPI000625B2D0|nr:uncharacterized protein LOC105703487 [Orussus abietinus]